MANPIHSGSGGDQKRMTPPPACAACEEMLADALDATLGPVDRAWFDRHIDTCSTCAEMLADAQRGAAWLEMLKSPRPEPRPELLTAILAHVEQASAGGADVAPAQTLIPGSLIPGSLIPGSRIPGSRIPESLPLESAALRPHLVRPAYPVPSNVLTMPARRPAMMRFGRFEIESRLAMTAAMAFFSVAVTLNLAGIRLNELKASSLTPTSLRHSFYETNARVIRYYDNLRVVQVVEARVDTLRTSQDDASRVSESSTSGEVGGASDQAKPGYRPGPKPGAGPASGQPSSGQPDEKDPGPGSRIEPIPGQPADPVSDPRPGASSLFVSPAWLRVDAGDLV